MLMFAMRNSLLFGYCVIVVIIFARLLRKLDFYEWFLVIGLLSLLNEYLVIIVIRWLYGYYAINWLCG